MFSVISLFLAGLAAYYVPKTIFSIETLVSVLATVFSVMAGFLIAIFSVLISITLPSSWKSLEINRRYILRDLAIFRALFVLYFTTLGLLVLILILDKVQPETPVLLWLKTSCIFVAVVAFLQSLALPKRVSSVYLRHYDQTISKDRKKS